MKIMKKKISIIALILSLLNAAHAADTAISPAIGPSIVSNTDFNNANRKSSLGFNIGFDAFYRLPCHRCQNLSLMMSSGYTTSGTFDFGSTRRTRTGHVGIFKESFQTFNWNVGINWSSRPIGKVKFNLFVAPGIYYDQTKNVSYKDGNNRDLPLPEGSRSGVRFGAVVGGGAEVMLSNKTSVGLSPRIHLNLSDLGGRSAIQFPLNFKFYF